MKWLIPIVIVCSVSYAEAAHNVEEIKAQQTIVFYQAKLWSNYHYARIEAQSLFEHYNQVALTWEQMATGALDLGNDELAAVLEEEAEWKWNSAAAAGTMYCEALNNETDAWALYMYELEILNNMLNK